MMDFKVVLLVVSLFVTCALSQHKFYPDADINVDDILKNDRLMNNYLECILGKRKCTSDGEELKKDIPESLENDCAKCTDKHREAIRKFLHHLVEKKPEWWKVLVAKYDPEGKYHRKYHKFLKDEGLVH